MLVLGILLVLLAAGAIVAAIVGGTGQPAVFDLGVVEVQTNAFGAFIIGASTVLLLVLGLALMRSGATRARRRRQERKELHRLHKQLGSDREAGAATTPGTTASTDHRAGDTATGPSTTPREGSGTENPPAR
jgi:hypothetical protein